MAARSVRATFRCNCNLSGGLASVVLGTARHALDTLNEIAQAKVPAATRATLRERPLAQTQFAQAEGLLHAARAYFYNCNDEIWRKGEAGESFSIQDRAHARLAVVTAAKLAVQAVDLVADAAGMNSAQTSCPIERCWRDVHTATQHVLMNTARFEVVGRVLFGLDPGIAGNLKSEFRLAMLVYITSADVQLSQFSDGVHNHRCAATRKSGNAGDHYGCCAPELL